MALAPLCASCSAGVGGRISPKSANASAQMMTSPTGDSTSSLGEVRLKDQSCQGFDLSPEKRLLSQQDLREHLDKRGIKYKVAIERDDLHLFDVELHGETARLRVATLDSEREAGRHLHLALLEHGQGYWGVHRGNLAVLGPEAAVEEAIGFALETGLACWGVLTAAGRDDTFVVGGGYTEL